MAGQDSAGCGLLAVASLAVGLTVNAWRAQPLALRYRPPEARLGTMVTRLPGILPPSSPITAWQAISLDEFQALVSARVGVSIDARPETLYAAGHVPGALDLPRADFERSFTAARATLEANAGRPVVVYCGAADCQDSELVAGALIHLGVRNVRVFKEGWEEWQRAGLPTEPPNRSTNQRL